MYEYYYDFLSDYRRGFVLDIGFIDNFTTQLVITLNYSAIADLHTLHTTVARARAHTHTHTHTHTQIFQPAVPSVDVSW
jgi:hypothetical protein